MVYYSQLVGRPIIDKNNKKIGFVNDLDFIDKRGYAVISGIIVEINKKNCIIPWKYIFEIREERNRKLQIGIYLNEEIKKIKYVSSGDKKLNNIIDKQLMDINGARIIRVNDIILGKRGNNLIIAGVDIGTKGLLRRLGLGFIPFNFKEQIILWKDLAPISDDTKGIMLKVKLDRINQLHPAEIADMIRDLNLEEKELFFNSLDRQKAAETLLTSQPDIQKSFFKALSINKIAKMLETLPHDDAAAILRMMPALNNRKVLQQMKPGIAAKIKKILSYDKETAGSLMGTRFLKIPGNLSVKKATEFLRKEMPKPQHIFYIYVEDKNNHLIGITSVRDLLLSKQNELITNIIKKDVITVNEDTDVDDVFNLMSKYGLLALPVIDKEKKILGVIRVNDILEVMIPRRIKKQRILRGKKLNINGIK